jgi:hypothetical protein
MVSIFKRFWAVLVVFLATLLAAFVFAVIGFLVVLPLGVGAYAAAVFAAICAIFGGAFAGPLWWPREDGRERSSQKEG